MLWRSAFGAGLAAALAACSAAPDPGPSRSTRIVWSESAGVQARAQDLGQCELSASGASAGMAQEQILALARQTTAEGRLERLEACLRARGYTVTDGRVCEAEDLAAGRLLRKPLTETLPPLDQVRCHDPATDGFVIG